MQSQTKTPVVIDRVNNLNITSQEVLITPAQLKITHPIPQASADFVARSRQSIANVLSGKDKRKLAIVGPCSIHDIDSAKEYALKLKKLSESLSDELFVVMRVYFEKPRTTVGWKGLINDPDLNNSFDVEKGLHTARELLLWLSEQSIPVATEMLDPISPQYLADLISWAAIGARTSESQTHREMASGLSMPIGFKNGTDGSASVAVNAMKSAATSHSFMGINQQGQVTLLNTAGNPFGHIILRGGVKPNYHPQDIVDYEKRLDKEGLNCRIMVDCSHGNSSKDHNKQTSVLENITQQIIDGNKSIVGFMLESHLFSGNQKLEQSNAQANSQLKYGVSITDACIDWETTQNCLQQCADKLKLSNGFVNELSMGVTF